MKYVVFVLIAFFLVTIGGGLIFFYSASGGSNTQTAAPFGPVIATRDGGLTWKSVGRQEVSGAALPSLSVSTIVGGPRPEKGYSYYLGTTTGGVWRSDDTGDRWLHITDKVLPPTLAVTTIGLDERNPATYFAAGVANGTSHLYRTKTFGQTFQEIYPTPSTQVLVTSVAVDPSDSSQVYLGTNGSGLFLTSKDFGTHWGEPQHTFNSAVRSIVVNYGHPDEVFVLTDNGLWRSQNRGSQWDQLARDQISYSISSGGRLAIDPLDSRVLYLSAGSQLLRSSDNTHQTWEIIKLPSQNVTISDVFIDPRNAAHLFVTYGRTIAASVDRGSSWALHQFAMSRIISRVFMDPFNPLSIIITTAAPISRGIF